MSISKYLIRNIHFQEDCDLVAIMDMSSYQFVNTLAQCYEANAQLQGGAVPGGESSKIIYPNQNVIVFFVLVAAGGVPGGGTDYYGMQYPSCYSPATQGYSTPAAPGQASVAAPGAYPGAMMGPGQAPPPGGPGTSSGII